jgi:hypothetical protein
VSTNSWEPPATGEPTEHFEWINAGNFAIGPWAIDNNGGAWLYNSRTGFFDGPIGGLPSGVSALQVTVGHGQAWVLSSESSDNVYVYDDNPTVEKWFHPNPFAVPTLSEIAESTDESLWGVSAGKVYLFDTSTILFGLTAQPAESVFEVKVGTAGVFVLSSGTATSTRSNKQSSGGLPLIPTRWRNGRWRRIALPRPLYASDTSKEWAFRVLLKGPFVAEYDRHLN